MLRRCLLLKLSDSRSFFTSEENYPSLVEFCKTFKVTVQIVEATDPPIMNLQQLCKAFCDQTQNSTNISYKVVGEKNISRNIPVNKKSIMIQDYLIEQLLNDGKIVISEVINKLNNISSSTIYRHLNEAKKKLQDQGKTVVKVLPGTYQLSKN